MSSEYTTAADATIIGHAVGSRAWIVNNGQLAPIGVPGELLIEGPNLAEGYLNDEDKTNSVFITDAVWLNRKPSRVYKTGDLVKYMSDGNIKYLGRKDTQVKLRGQRVELSEIEHRIRQVTSFLDVVVDLVAKSNQNGDPLLLAFVSGSETYLDDSPLDWKDLQRDLAKFLPRYMIPSMFVHLDNMPLTVSGKTDRKSLRERALHLSLEPIAHYDDKLIHKKQPLTEMEIKLRLLWAKTLGIEPNDIYLDDDFFELHGDSISAMKLVAAARSKHLSITVVDIFQNSTLRGMSLATSVIVDSEDNSPVPFTLLGLDDPKDLRNEAANICQLSPDSIEDMYPCTALQEGLMALSVKQPGAYVANYTMKLNSDIDLDRFRKAWETVVQNNPILRTRIIQTEFSGCLQVVLKGNIKWVSQHPSEPSAETETYMGFGQSLSRHALVPSPDKSTWQFYWTAHHAIYDGYSLQLIIGEVDRAYHGEATALATSNFSRFIRHLSSVNIKDTEDYWNSYLSDFKSSPLFHSQPSHYQPRADTNLAKHFSFTRALISSTSNSTLIHAAWAMVLSWYSSTNDIVFGSTLSGRNASVSGIDQILGPTITTIPVRVQLNDDQTLLELFESISTRATSVIPYEQTGLQNIRRLSSSTKAASEFQTLIVVQAKEDTINIADSSGGSLFDEFHASGNLTEFYTYPITLEVTPVSSGVQASVNFDSTLIDKRQMGRMLDQFGNVLSQLSSHKADTQIRDIQRTSPEDHAEILKWNEHIPQAVNECIHHLIEQQLQVNHQSEQPAVYSWDGEFSWRELDDAASCLASELVHRGIIAQDFVPICFEKSKWSIVAILGVLKSGGAFVPLDPAQPLKRLQGIVQDIAPKVFLTSSLYTELCSKTIANCQNTSVITLNEMWISEEQANFNSIRSQLGKVQVTPKDAAYALYTSGSTGVPKAVVVSHTAVSTSTTSFGTVLNFQRTTRSLQFASYTFDASIAEIIATLVFGGCVCVPSDTDRMNNLAVTMQQMEVNWAFFTPSVIRLLIPREVPSLKTLVLGGEALSEDVVSIWRGQYYSYLFLAMAEVGNLLYI